MTVVTGGVVGTTSLADNLPKNRNSSSSVPLAVWNSSTILLLVTFDVGSKTRSKSTPTLPRKNLIIRMATKKRNVLLQKDSKMAVISTMRVRDLGELMSS